MEPSSKAGPYEYEFANYNKEVRAMKMNLILLLK